MGLDIGDHPNVCESVPAIYETGPLYLGQGTFSEIFCKTSCHPRHDNFRNANIIKIRPSAGTPYGNGYHMEYWPKGVF
jgi:hypothetical protein